MVMFKVCLFFDGHAQDRFGRLDETQLFLPAGQADEIQGMVAEMARTSARRWPMVSTTLSTGVLAPR